MKACRRVWLILDEDLFAPPPLVESRRRLPYNRMVGYRGVSSLDQSEESVLAALWKAYNSWLVADLLRAAVLSEAVPGSLRCCADETDKTRP